MCAAEERELGAEVRRIYEAQRAASDAASPPDLRVRLGRLDRLEAMLLANRERFGGAISADFGNRALPETDLLELLPTRNAIRHARKHLPRWMRPQRRHVSPLFRPARAWVQYQPLGVIGIIAPWNYPLLLSLSPVTDALAAGNRVLLKPSELTPRLSELLKRLLAEAFDETEVAVLLGGAGVAEALTKLPLDHLLFTGSAEVGRKVMRATADNLTPVTLELGGKSPVIVCPDYPIGKAARTIAIGKFLNAGQTCVAPDYVLAPAAEATALAEQIIAEAHRLYPRIDANPDYTSMISDRHYRRLTEAVKAARLAGGRVLSHRDGEAKSARKIAPTVMLDPPPDGALMSEEIFGPVLPVVPYTSLDEAIRFINARGRPLALYCLASERKSWKRVLNRTLSGGITLNGTLLHVAQDDLPFGGVGASGFGAYHGYEGFRRFSHARAVHRVGFVSLLEKLAPPFGHVTQIATRLLLGPSRSREQEAPGERV